MMINGKPTTIFEICLHDLIHKNTELLSREVKGIEKKVLYEKLAQKGVKKGFQVTEELFNNTLDFFDYHNIIGIKDENVYLLSLL